MQKQTYKMNLKWLDFMTGCNHNKNYCIAHHSKNRLNNKLNNWAESNGNKLGMTLNWTQIELNVSNQTEQNGSIALQNVTKYFICNYDDKNENNFSFFNRLKPWI